MRVCVRSRAMCIIICVFYVRGCVLEQARARARVCAYVCARVCVCHNQQRTDEHFFAIWILLADLIKFRLTHARCRKS